MAAMKRFKRSLFFVSKLLVVTKPVPRMLMPSSEIISGLEIAALAATVGAWVKIQPVIASALPLRRAWISWRPSC